MFPRAVDVPGYALLSFFAYLTHRIFSNLRVISAHSGFKSPSPHHIIGVTAKIQNWVVAVSFSKNPEHGIP
jgi:hypothetical protein